MISVTWASVPSPLGDQGDNADQQGRFRDPLGKLLVCNQIGVPHEFFELPTFFEARRNDSCARESSPQPVIPPAPLTGDRGRDRGDAGRALFCVAIRLT